MSWLVRNYQGRRHFAGENTGTHFKAILERDRSLRETIKLKDPKSSVYDGFPVAKGTDMRAIFKWASAGGSGRPRALENDSRGATPHAVLRP